MLTIKQFLKELEKHNDDLMVTLDFGNFVPMLKLDSYRGYYVDMALAFKELDGKPVPKNKELQDFIKSCIGNIYDGYKGGLFKVEEDSRLWIANYGINTSTAIKSVTFERYILIINTYYNEG